MDVIFFIFCVSLSSFLCPTLASSFSPLFSRLFLSPPFFFYFWSWYFFSFGINALLTCHPPHPPPSPPCFFHVSVSRCFIWCVLSLCWWWQSSLVTPGLAANTRALGKEMRKVAAIKQSPVMNDVWLSLNNQCLTLGPNIFRRLNE